MPYAWQSVEEAALTLGISARTLHRRIAKGEVETRLANGRREVLVCLEEPDPEPEAAEPEHTTFASTPIDVDSITQPAPAPQPVSLAAQPHVTSAVNSPPVSVAAPSYVQPMHSMPHPEMSTAIVVAEKEIAMANERVRRTELALAAFQHTSSLLEREAGRSRVSARLAWAAVAILSVGVYVAVGWTAARVTRAKADHEHLTGQLQSVSTTGDQRVVEIQQLREQLARFQQNAARAEGELQATRALLLAKEAALQEAQKKPATQPSWIERIVRMTPE